MLHTRLTTAVLLASVCLVLVAVLVFAAVQN
jgi:hypothetical protein